MYDIILIHDLDVHELGVRGELTGGDAAIDLGRCLSCLSRAGSVVLDLTGVVRIDDATAASLARAVAALAAGDVAVAYAVCSPGVRSVLVKVSANSYAPICGDVDEARVAARRTLAA